MSETARPRILLVDDEPHLLEAMRRNLRTEFDITPARSGAEAIDVLENKGPFAVLVSDLRMPGGGGVTVLRQACKLAPDTTRILLTGKADLESAIAIVNEGAIFRFLAKPCPPDVLLKTLEAAVEQNRLVTAERELRQRLQQQNDDLEELIFARTRELAEAHARLKILDKAKNDFLSLISHELRTPLSGLLGVGELLLEESRSGEEADRLRGMFEASRSRILAMVEHAELLTRVEVEGDQFASEPVSLDAVLGSAVAQTQEFAQTRQVTLEWRPTHQHVVFGTQSLLVKAFQALLETAAKFSRAREAVRVAYDRSPDTVNVVVESRGYTIPLHILPRFFDVFSVGEAIIPGGDLGLGPPVAYRILSLLGGSVGVSNHPSGIRMTVSLKGALPDWRGLECRASRPAGIAGRELAVGPDRG